MASPPQSQKKFILSIIAIVAAFAAFGLMRKLTDTRPQEAYVGDYCVPEQREPQRTIVVVWDQTAAMSIDNRGALNNILRSLVSHIHGQDRLIFRIINDAETAAATGADVRTVFNRCRCRTLSGTGVCLNPLRDHFQARRATDGDRRRSRNFVDDLAEALRFPDDAGPRRHLVLISDFDKPEVSPSRPLPALEQVRTNLMLISDDKTPRVSKLQRLKKWRDWQRASGAVIERVDDWVFVNPSRSL